MNDQISQAFLIGFFTFLIGFFTGAICLAAAKLVINLITPDDKPDK